MHTRRMTVIGALVAGAAVVGAWVGGTAMAQPTEERANTMRLATLDIYILSEKVMNRAELLKPRETIDARYQQQLQALEKQVQDIDARLTALERTPQDPQVRPLFEQRQAKVEEYQQAVQKLNQEKEELLASQLGSVYREVRQVAAAVAQRQGYSHVISNRRLDDATKAVTAGDALQDMLARPALVFPAGDDLTEAVAAELKVDLTAPPAPEPTPQAPAPQPAPAPQR
jgi:Skp family chaperone for outer membrane proteins